MRRFAPADRQRAYAALQEEGLLTTMQGRGSFVADVPSPPRNRDAEIKLLAARVAAQAQAAVEVALETLRGRAEARGRPGVARVS